MEKSTPLSKRLRILAIALLGGTIVLDAGVLEMRYLIPSSTQESDSNFMNNPGANGALLVRLGEQEGKRCDLIFIGASNVEYWNTTGKAVWDHYYGPRHAFNFGVGGDKTENVLWRIDHMNLKSMAPKAAVIFIGLNNFGDTPHEIAVGVDAVLKKTQQVFPGIKILLVSQTPNPRDADKIVETNRRVKAYADGKRIFYIDLYRRMPRMGDHWKGLGPDQIHLSAEGYEMWAEEMEPVLQNILPGGPMASNQAVETH